jgi:alpha-galactosidase
MTTAPQTVQAGPLTISCDAPAAPARLAVAARDGGGGVWLVDVELSFPVPSQPAPLTLRWPFPCRDVLAQWRGDCAGLRGAFPPDWGRQAVAGRACSQSPVICLHSEAGVSQLTFAVEDVVHLSRLYAGVREEDGTFTCEAELFAGHLPPATTFRATLRIDTAPRRWEGALADVAAWWESLYPPAPTPDVGRRPFYCTWYTFHQRLRSDEIEAECAIARELGCEALIIDDGWQTLDSNRGYAYTGDWQPERLTDLADHVRRLHALGMKVLLWYAVPYVGFKSRSHARFAGKYVYDDQRHQASLLDPRYPDVRRHLVDLYTRAMRDWDLDGFKLDFVDAWRLPDAASARLKPGMDTADLDDAVVRAMTDVMSALRAIKPDALIEFRQSYVGPVMRTFGNLFRAGDCPVDAIGNRQRTLDLRVLAGRSAVHADPVMWHASEPVESAALQLLNVLFAVPQLSVRLASLPADHLAMVRFWLGWWREHRAALLDGALTLDHPEARYTQATARGDAERVTCVFQQVPATVPANDPATNHIVNATRTPGVVLKLDAPWRGQFTVRDVLGRVTLDEPRTFAAGLHELAVPPAGLVTMTMA